MTDYKELLKRAHGTWVAAAVKYAAATVWQEPRESALETRNGVQVCKVAIVFSEQIKYDPLLTAFALPATR